MSNIWAVGAKLMHNVLAVMGIHYTLNMCLMFFFDLMAMFVILQPHLYGNKASCW